MADRKETEVSPTDEGQVPRQEEPSSGGPPSPSLDEQVEAALGRLADSGRLFGGGGDSSSPREQPAHAPAAPASSEGPSGPDLEGLIERVLERRETASRERQERDSMSTRLDQLQRQVEGQGKRVRRWFEPWSPFSGE